MAAATNAARSVPRRHWRSYGNDPLPLDDGWGGRVAKAELLTGLECVSSRPVRRIVLVER